MSLAKDPKEPVFEFEDLLQDDLHRSSRGEECTSYCLSDKLIAIGYESGCIKVIDYNGDTVSPCAFYTCIFLSSFCGPGVETKNVSGTDLDL